MINLLPKEEKEGLLLTERFKICLTISLLVFGFLFVLSALVFLVKINLDFQVSSQKMAIDLEEKRFENQAVIDLRKRVSELNSNLKKLDQFYASQENIPEIFIKVSDLLPEGVYLTLFSYQKSSVQLNGFAPTREDLVELKSRLESDPLFSEVDFPQSNWAKPKDINFSLSIKIKK